jgi:hypothetical protein
VFLVFGFGEMGYVLKTRALKICGKERETKFICIGLDFVVDANSMDYRYHSILCDIYR